MDFSYTPLNARGGKNTKRMEAGSEGQALRSLQKQGYLVLSPPPAPARKAAGGGPRLALAFARRAKLEQVAMLTREFAIMIETGVPVVEALEALQEHADSPAIRDALAATHADLAMGKTMA